MANLIEISIANKRAEVLVKLNKPLSSSATPVEKLIYDERKISLEKSLISIDLAIDKAKTASAKIGFLKICSKNEGSIREAQYGVATFSIPTENAGILSALEVFGAEKGDLQTKFWCKKEMLANYLNWLNCKYIIKHI